MSARRSNEKIAEPAEMLYIPVEGVEEYHAAAVYHAVLAYPARDEWPKRVEFVRASRGRHIKLRRAAGAAGKDLPHPYRSLKNEKIKGILSKGFRRVTWRVQAACMAIGIIYKDDPNGWTSINKAATWLMGETRKAQGVRSHDPGESRANLVHRIWASSMPVLHLAIPLVWITGSEAARASLSSVEVLEKLMFQRHWVEYALRLAEEQCKPLLTANILTYDPNKAIRLLPTRDLTDSYLLLPEDFQPRR